MTPPGTFERVYSALKQRLRAGAYRPGERLEPAALSEELNTSVTPVRDALHRLTGERLVEAPRHEGFRVPMLTEPMLRQLYRWHLDLLLLAVMKNRAADKGRESLLAEVDRDGPAHQRLNGLFLAVVQFGGNIEHIAALRSLNDRLEPVQRFEAAFLDELEEESSEIARALDRREWKALRRSLVRYHRRRDRIVPDLLARLLEA